MTVIITHLHSMFLAFYLLLCFLKYVAFMLRSFIRSDKSKAIMRFELYESKTEEALSYYCVQLHESLKRNYFVSMLFIYSRGSKMCFYSSSIRDTSWIFIKFLLKSKKFSWKILSTICREVCIVLGFLGNFFLFNVVYRHQKNRWR